MTARKGRGLFRGIERFLVGIVFGFIAFVIERRVIRAIKRGKLAGKEPTAKPGLTAERQGDRLVVTPKQVEE